MSTDEATASRHPDRERTRPDARRGPAVGAAAHPPEPRSAGGPVGGPVKSAWREGTLTRAQEPESLSAWIQGHAPTDDSAILLEAVGLHVRAAREAALTPRRWFSDEPLLERAMSNLDAAEALMLDVASPEYLLGRLPGVLNDATRHLPATDARRRELERIARRVGIGDPATPLVDGASTQTPEDALAIVSRERLTIATASRAANSTRLVDQQGHSVLNSVRAGSRTATRTSA